jgi:hypothetical protein
MNNLLHTALKGDDAIAFGLINDAEDRKHFRVERLPPQHRLVLTNGMRYVLGFKQVELTTIDTAVKSAFSVDMKRGAFAMFIYCDICEPICVGDLVASLLRTAHHTTSKERGSVTHQVFDPPIYIPICKRWVNTIGIDIRTDTGEIFPFSPDAKFLMTLHFKREFI